MQTLLETINGPEDLRAVPLEKLPQLAQEIRDWLIACVARRGGHLAPNLGVVELTIALHRQFDSPSDKIVWDVGHQSYVHKILTGRREELESLRARGGVAGFPRPDESEHDAFGTGHGSTSISAALGLAKARDLRAGAEHVVAVIGDGALTGGLAFEGLNQAGHLRPRLIVVLNDNGMAIARNVGAMSRYLSRIRSDPYYLKMKSDFEWVMQKTAIGTAILEAVERAKDGMKRLLVPGMLFEELGFTYLGPVDGHDIPALEETLSRAKAVDGPVLVHVVTQKGRGYAPAESDAERFHGTSPFVVQSGLARTERKAPSYSVVFGRALRREARADARIVAITAAMRHATGLAGFAREFPDRFFDVGMAEAHAITFAAGLAKEGYRPVAAIYSTFAQRGFDQLLHDVCIQKLPVVIAMDRSGIVGNDGPTHQGVFDLSYVRMMPNVVLAAPSGAQELADLLHTALAHDGPFVIRYPRSEAPGAAERDPEVLPLGAWEVVRTGEHATILAVGSEVGEALRASDILTEFHLSVGVVNCRFVKPLDTGLLHSLAASGRLLVTAEDNVLAGGFGAAVAEELADAGIAARLVRAGIGDRFVEHGSRVELLGEEGLTGEALAELVRSRLTAQDRRPSGIRDPAPADEGREVTS
jgi:1-deoxy-D-xylulose-5-phosphate synthase